MQGCRSPDRRYEARTCRNARAEEDLPRMHDLLIGLTVLAMVFSPCVLALFTLPMQGEDNEFRIRLIKTR